MVKSHELPLAKNFMSAHPHTPPIVPPEVAQEVRAMVEQQQNAQAIFGKPIHQGELTIVPVAATYLKGGGGIGGGIGSKQNAGQTEIKTGNGNGGGFGFSLSTQPVGYIEINEVEARFIPVEQPDRRFLIKAGLTFLVVWRLLHRLTRRNRKR